MAETWVGKDERAGLPIEPRPDVEPPPHWRLEAIAATHRPRSLTVGAGGRVAVFVEDRDTSDVWMLDLEEGGPPERLTTGRELTPYWADAEPRVSPDGSTVAYADGDHVWLAPTAGGPPRKLVEGGAPVWVDDARLLIVVERDKRSRLAVLDVADPWPRRLTRDDAIGDEGDAVASPDGQGVAFTFRRREDLSHIELRVADVESGATRTVASTPNMELRSPAWSPDGATLAYASEAPGFYEIHLVEAAGGEPRQLTREGASFHGLAWSPDGGRLAAVRDRRNRFDLVLVDPADGRVSPLAPGGWWEAAHWTSHGELIGAYEDAATPPELRVAAPGLEPRTLLAPAPLAVKRAPHVVPEEVVYPSFDGLEIPAWLFRPRDASSERPAPAVVYPHGGPTMAYADEWDGHAQYFLDKGYAWIAPNFRGSTGYGRDFERANHGVWGVADTKDCLAAADFLRTLDWIDGERLAIFGASYGSYLALLSAVDDPDRRFRCAVAKYGDSDIATSWAQGDREGRQDLERMMGTPRQAPEAYRAGSPVHRLETLQVPLLIAHGEQDIRVSPKQSEELVGELKRLGKSFEYVTYPTEGHGFFHAAPQIDFYRRLERFLDWRLM